MCFFFFFFFLQIVIATPGRLCELAFDRRRIKLGNVRTVVLDEVDALLRPPYDQEIDAIVDATPRGVKKNTQKKSVTCRMCDFILQPVFFCVVFFCSSTFFFFTDEFVGSKTVDPGSARGSSRAKR